MSRDQINEKRRHIRVWVRFFPDCFVRLHEPDMRVALLEEFSLGGMRLLVDSNLPKEKLVLGKKIAGTIESENPALRMPFSGQVRWYKMLGDESVGAMHVGIEFDKDIELSEILQSLHTAEKRDGT